MNTTSNLDQYGTLYRNADGHEVWRITAPDGTVYAEDVAGDYDAAWLADQLAASLTK